MKQKLIQGKSIFYTLIIIFLCIVDQRRGSAAGHVQFIYINLAGIAICLLMFSTYRLKEFCKLPYWLWSAVYWPGAIAVTYLCNDLIVYRGQWYTALLNIWLMGLLLIKLVIRIVCEKYRPSFSMKALLLFLGFILLACLSRNDSLWTWWYLFLFGMLYLTEFSSEDRKRLLNAVSNGIIISFFLLQGLAFVFRPYDVLRYRGFYANPNINALFYSLVYCALLGKYCIYFGKDKEMKHCRTIRIGVLLLCGAMWSFVCFTMCRTAMLSMAFTTACAGIYCLCKIRKKIIRNAIGMIAGLVLSIIICAPVSYCAVRYLPPLFHHPIWFEGEYLPIRVHSWDPIDSPKFIRWEQIMDELLGRWKQVDLSDLFAEDEAEQIMYIASADSDRMVARFVQSNMLLMNNYATSGVNVRVEIFKHYLGYLNMWGHTNDDDNAGFQITEISWVPHAHNLFIQMAFWFGIPSAIFLISWIGYGMITAARQAFRAPGDAGMLVVLLFYINIVVFGMLEIVWLTGQMSFTLLFVMPLFIYDKNQTAIDRNKVENV